jgi:hypothetical protein
MYAQLSPLRAMQQAVATHWRAAAWFLERAYPDRFARRDPAAFAPKQARRLLSEVLDILRGEILDIFLYERIEKRLRPTFEYLIRDACDQRRSSRDLRRAMQFFDEKDRLNDPFAPFKFPSPNFASVHAPTPPSAKRQPAPQPNVVRASQVAPDPSVVRKSPDPSVVMRGSPDPSVVRGSPDPAPSPTEGLPAAAPEAPIDPALPPATLANFAAALRDACREVEAPNVSTNVPSN